MSNFEDYAERFPNIAMERRDGILHLRFHTDERSLVWGARPHADWPLAFSEVGADFALQADQLLALERLKGQRGLGQFGEGLFDGQTAALAGDQLGA